MSATAGASVPPPDEGPAGVLPAPNPFVSNLDLECFTTPGPALNLQLQLTHLNPVLIQLGLPSHSVVIRELVQTCVPVMKNGVSPPSTVLPFVSHVDFACYRVEAAALVNPVTLTLKHLNPVLGNLPSHAVTLLAPEQLCVPVGKNGVKPPDEVLGLVQYLDLECWRTSATTHPTFSVALRQLNPQLGNIPQHELTLGSANRQMCVPVRKGTQGIPTTALNIIQWVDLEKFQAATAVTVSPVTVVLDHLNPLFTTLPRVQVTLQQATALMVPVTKNGATPPSQ